MSIFPMRLLMLKRPIGGTKAFTLIILLITTLLPVYSAQAQSINTAWLCGTNCTLIIANDKGVIKQINPHRATVPFSPFSTFKIPNSLIALDTGVIKNLSQMLSFDKNKYPRQGWWPEIWYQNPVTLPIAFSHSAVPIFRQLTVEIGASRMQQYLNKFNYGNHDISSGINGFWLNGSLKISAQQQINFLRQLHQGKLPVKGQSLAALKQVMLIQQTAYYRLYGKTGGGEIGNNRYLGWYVGYIESATKDISYFAMNIEGDSFWPTMDKRVPIMQQALAAEGLM